MATFEKDAVLINRYLNGQLNSTEQQLFEEKLHNDSGFAELYEEIQLAKQAIRGKVLSSNFKQLQQFERTLPEVVLEDVGSTSSPGKLKSLRHKWTVAAGILFFVLAGSFLVSYCFNKNERLFQQAFTIYPNLETERGINTARSKKEALEIKKANTAQAYLYYDDEEWADAIVAIQQLITDYDRPMDYYYLGISQMANNDPAAAIQTFETLLLKESEYISRAKWYLALAYLDHKEKEKAVATLEDIVNNDNPKSYQEKAKKLLSKLK